jgi:hypothetical protein
MSNIEAAKAIRGGLRCRNPFQSVKRAAVSKKAGKEVWTQMHTDKK